VIGVNAGVRRPWVVTALVLAFAAAPALQAASLAGLRVLNFAPDRPWNYLAYGLAAPYVAVLQLPSARRYAPSLRPAEILGRLPGRRPRGPRGPET